MRCRAVLAAITATLALALVLASAPPAARATPSASSKHPTPAALARLDGANLAIAAVTIAQQASDGGAVMHGFRSWEPARMLLTALGALIGMARAEDPTLAPTDTTAFMGPVPHNLSHHLRRPPPHRRVETTHLLSTFRHAVTHRGSFGIGHDRTHDGATPAPFQSPDGVLVDPKMPAAKPATVGMVALRAALRELGQPYVWGGAGPTVYDCSGLVQWAYASAGLRLTHHAADQWNEGRLIPARDILPGDLIMFGRPIFHVGMYLGAGWMLNAPYTGQYVDVVPVPTRVAGVIRP